MSTTRGAQEILGRLKEAIIRYDVEAARRAAQEVVDRGLDPLRAIEEAIGGSGNVLAEKFERGEYYLPHLVMAADAMNAASQVLEAAIPRGSMPQKRVVVIGTVEADLHSVGKNIVAMMLKTGGFEVHDLGVDVRSSAFVNRARETGAHIIALSSLMTTTRPYQREVIEELESLGLRTRFKVMVGGGPVTEEWAKEIGADGYGKDAMEALAVARKLVG